MTSGHDVPANLAQARHWLAQARERDARLAALPENFPFMGLKDADKRAIGEADGSGPIQDFLAATARELGLWIVAGTMPIRASGDGRVAAASLVFDDSGRRVARYDKIHLFDVDIPGKAETYRESAHVAAGNEPVVVDTPVGRVGLSVCYDMRFPELFRKLSAAGAQVIMVPSAFTAPTGRAHWETLLRARAIENLCHVVRGPVRFHANGRDVRRQHDHRPLGRGTAALARGQGCVVADVDLNLQAAPARFPALTHRVL
jgi:nitrilase